MSIKKKHQVWGLSELVADNILAHCRNQRTGIREFFVKLLEKPNFCYFFQMFHLSTSSIAVAGAVIGAVLAPHHCYLCDCAVDSSKKEIILPWQSVGNFFAGVQLRISACQSLSLQLLMWKVWGIEIKILLGICKMASFIRKSQTTSWTVARAIRDKIYSFFFSPTVY